VWQRGSFALTVNEIRDGVIVLRSTSRRIQVGASIVTTSPDSNGFVIAAPVVVGLGQSFSVTVTGFDVDSIIEVQARPTGEVGETTLGWALTDASGTATVTSSIWAAGPYNLTVTEWRYGTRRSTQSTSLSVN
jgi:hypothetical protein